MNDGENWGENFETTRSPMPDTDPLEELKARACKNGTEDEWCCHCLRWSAAWEKERAERAGWSKKDQDLLSKIVGDAEAQLTALRVEALKVAEEIADSGPAGTDQWAARLRKACE